MNRFGNKSVVVTGAGSGLCLGATERIAGDRANLLLVDVDADALDEAKTAIDDAGGPGRVVVQTANVANEAEVRAYVAGAVDEFGRIDAFFDNAGVEGRQALTEDFGAEAFERVRSVNLKGVFFGMAAVLPVMRDQGHGSIVNTASVGGIRGVGNQSAYSASKHGVVGLTRTRLSSTGDSGSRSTPSRPERS